MKGEVVIDEAANPFGCGDALIERVLPDQPPRQRVKAHVYRDTIQF